MIQKEITLLLQGIIVSTFSNKQFQNLKYHVVQPFTLLSRFPCQFLIQQVLCIHLPAICCSSPWYFFYIELAFSTCCWLDRRVMLVEIPHVYFVRDGLWHLSQSINICIVLCDMQICIISLHFIFYSCPLNHLVILSHHIAWYCDSGAFLNINDSCADQA